MNRWKTTAGVAAIAVLMAIILRSQGRVWHCACRGWNLWSGDVWSSHNSQHFLDPYSFTHVLHGVLFAGAFRWLRPDWSIGVTLLLTTAGEAAWEIVENSRFVIDRYRDATISLSYFGDSIVNSLGDLGTCLLGFALARRIGVWKSMAFFLVTEAVLAIWIRDNLLLNVLMLLFPVDAIKAWQMGQ